ncbi:glycosyltransferase family 4 protein [Marivirga atlantica]|uniref:Glycosyltransferase n=1 Tax=Marivirga atlantica TaxID=1548457 RepID=A0A937DHC5_9BACT|nr:glycosyltransferase family 4 protein [Marivirga atlantica]MBL0763850.1 glycosyltransferase [Marivirga atlantica]
MSKVRVLHVLYESLPIISGSTIRSRDILDSQLNSVNIHPVVLTSPFQSGESKLDIINGVKTYRYLGNKNETASENIRKNPIVLLKKFLRIFLFTFRIIKVSKLEEIDVIHAHAMFFCAISSKMAGLYLGKPVVYEVRSLWEERGRLSRPFLTRIFVWLENISLKVSNSVICINENLRRELIDRSNLKKEIYIVPNAVNFNQIKQASLNISGELTFGYIGTLSPIEGLDLLLQAAYDLKKIGIEIKIKLFGTGVYEDSLKKMLIKLNLNNVSLMGSISPVDIHLAYRQVDVIVNPRKKSKLSDMVTPLKPLEALAYRKLLLVSDVGGMKQLISQDDIVYNFSADDKESLKNTLVKVLNSSAKERMKRIDNGYNFVLKNKNWTSNAEKYYSIYKNL